MPIISAEPIEKNIYRITINTGYGKLENLVVSQDGLYNVYYIKDCICINKTGKILNVVQNRSMPKNSYILFDWSDDQANRRERIHFYKIQNIIDITPNDAYQIAIEHGFVGTVTDWLESLKGDPGKSAYELAVDAGFTGTEAEWLATAQGTPGLSAYEIATKNGFVGTEAEWLATLKGEPGDSAYELAVKNGYTGTEEEWLANCQGAPGLSAYEIAVQKYGYIGTEEEWLTAFGDVTVVNNKVKDLEESVTWIEGMVKASP